MEIEAFEKEEEQRYDKRVEQMKRELQNANGVLSAE